jgi:rhamnopyranosyl-N-acetylglucosaminyl-diphospho-decaprenol beta-1,3/1,4-galactofuranosyltransferase
VETSRQKDERLMQQSGRVDLEAVGRSVTASILSFNSLESLRKVLDGVLAQSVRPGRIVIVDNASTDGTRLWLEALRATELPVQVQVVTLDSNLGVGAGHWVGWNEALRQADCRFVWVLEHDTMAYESCLATLVDEMSTSHGDLGAVAPRAPRDNEHYERLLTRPIPERAAGRFTFNGVLLSREAIEHTGPPRADFFVGQEDWDFSHRVVLAGFGVKRVNAWVIHRTSGNLRFGVLPSPTRSYYSLRNEYVLLREQLGWRAVLQIGKRTALGMGRTLLKENHKLHRIAARTMACVDALALRLGPRRYWFMR